MLPPRAQLAAEKQFLANRWRCTSNGRPGRGKPMTESDLRWSRCPGWSSGIRPSGVSAECRITA